MINLYSYIKAYYAGREREAMSYLWSLYERADPVTQHQAYSTLLAVQTNLELDEQIARAKRGMYHQPTVKGKYDNG